MKTSSLFIMKGVYGNFVPYGWWAMEMNVEEANLMDVWENMLTWLRICSQLRDLSHMLKIYILPE